MNSELKTDFSELDAQSVLAVRNGDAERYRELVERHERRVFAVAWSRLGDPTLAEEVTQEAFIRGYRQLWKLGDAAKFAGWITAIARHAAINLGLSHRRELDKRSRWALDHTNPPEDNPGEQNNPYTPELLRQTLEEMPPAQRECLVLFYLEGKSGTEAAASLGVAEGTFRVRLHRAKAELREHLEAKLEESLETLRPAKALAPAIMAVVLVSSSAKAATASAAGAGLGAKILSNVGASALLSWAAPLFSVVGTLPGMFVAWLVARAEQRNFRDRDGFRPKLYQGFFRTFLWGFPLFFLLFALLNRGAGVAWGIRGVYLWTSCFLLVPLILLGRGLVISRHPFQVGMFFYGLILATGAWAVTLGLIPPTLSALPIILSSVVLLLCIKHRPARMDYSLFIRASEGLLHAPTEEVDVPTGEQTRSSLLTFARFLGERFLVNNHRWEAEGLALRLNPAHVHFAKGMLAAFLPVTKRSSRIVLGWDGVVTVHCGSQDAASLRNLSPGRTQTVKELEDVVAEAVQEAWRQAQNNNTVAADRALSEIPEAEVFAVPPARAKSTRLLQWMLGGATALMIVSMIIGHVGSRLQAVSGRHLKPVELTETEVRASLAQLATRTNAVAMARDLVMAGQGCVVLPPRELFTDAAWKVLRTKLQGEYISRFQGTTPRDSLDLLLGFPSLQEAFLNGWVSAEDLHLGGDTARQAVLDMSAGMDRLFELESGSVGKHDGTLLEFTVLNTAPVAQRIRTSKRLGALDLIDGSNTVSTLLSHQVLSRKLPPGRRQDVDPKLLHGTFLTFGFDPLQETWHALVILDAFGALSKIDRDACIEGILRFHHGKGLFGSARKEDGFVIFGDTRDTLCAYESLRMLGGLDRVKDLERWRFRPHGTSPPSKNQAPRILTENELEAWVCQERLNKAVREHKENPQSPMPSLLEP